MRTSMHAASCRRRRPPQGGLLAPRDQRGSVIVIVIVFISIFVVLGGALYALVISQTRATELERTDIKAFNVAEAGIDAGMLRLRQGWPETAAETVNPNDPALTTALRDAIRAASNGLWISERPGDSSTASSDRAATPFIKVKLYDNVTFVNGTWQTSNVPDDSAAGYDSNKDGQMFVDSTAYVDNDRHRILVLAELQKWQLNFSPKLALWASVVDSNGTGTGVGVEDPNPAPYVPYAYYDVHDPLGKGIDPGYAIAAAPNSTTFENVFPESLRASLEALAITQGTYFTSAAAVNTFLSTGQANGKVVYLKTSVAVVIESNTQMGTVEKPVVLVMDTPDGSYNAWDNRGTADFYGILITIGHNELRGTCGIHGALYASGTLLNKGNGTIDEVSYNQSVINNINGMYPISVNIVPNTWEEYTTPAT